MRIEKFAEPGEIDATELGSAIYFDLAEGADPAELIRFLNERVELPLEDCQQLVGQRNAMLEEQMHVVADALVEQRERPAELIGRLAAQGWPDALAEAFVGRVQRDLEQLAQTSAGREQLMAKARRGMWIGLAWFAGGAFATWFTGYSAEHGNGSYQLLAFGPILFGLALFGTSAVRWCRYRFSGSQTRA